MLQYRQVTRQKFPGISITVPDWRHYPIRIARQSEVPKSETVPIRLGPSFLPEVNRWIQHTPTTGPPKMLRQALDGLAILQIIYDAWARLTSLGRNQNAQAGKESH